jgi:chromate transporter
VLEGSIPQAPRLRDIFVCFFFIGAQSFGGGLNAWIRREVVKKRGWLTDPQFLSALAVCQVAPGPNPMNMAVFLGSQLRGTAGALVAFAGLMAVPVVLVLGIGAFYFGNRHLPGLETLLAGLGAVAIGMNIANALRLSRRNIVAARQIIVVALVIFVVGILQWPLLYVLAVAIPLSILVEWRTAP